MDALDLPDLRNEMSSTMRHMKRAAVAVVVVVVVILASILLTTGVVR